LNLNYFGFIGYFLVFLGEGGPKHHKTVLAIVLAKISTQKNVGLFPSIFLSRF
jgi:hypothetical protein